MILLVFVIVDNDVVIDVDDNLLLLLLLVWVFIQVQHNHTKNIFIKFWLQNSKQIKTINKNDYDRRNTNLSRN